MSFLAFLNGRSHTRAHTHTDILFGKLLNSPLKHRKVVAEKGRGSFKKLNVAQRSTVKESLLFTSWPFLLDDRSVRNTFLALKETIQEALSQSRQQVKQESRNATVTDGTRYRLLLLY